MRHFRRFFWWLRALFTRRPKRSTVAEALQVLDRAAALPQNVTALPRIKYQEALRVIGRLKQQSFTPDERRRRRNARKAASC